MGLVVPMCDEQVRKNRNLRSTHRANLEKRGALKVSTELNGTLVAFQAALKAYDALTSSRIPLTSVFLVQSGSLPALSMGYGTNGMMLQLITDYQRSHLY